MAVTVTLATGNRDKRADGTDLTIEDKHLVVANESGWTVAVYAPGYWFTASVDVAGKAD